jgi:predicted dehydrogenase
MQAGKDVYVEKPVSHNISEGRRMVQAARKFNRICQTGTQSRSMEGMRQAIEYVRDKIGKVEVARGICFKFRPSIGKVDAEQEPPKTMDYDLWCGPAPLKRPRRNTSNGTVHYDWHWFWDYGNGDLGNQGIHEMDKARWGLAKNELPLSVISLGCRLGYKDDGETPNTQLSLIRYAGSEIIFEVHGLASRTPYPEAVNKQGVQGPNFIGNIFYGSEGTVVCPSYSTGFALDEKGAIIREFKGEGDHFGNFVQAVRSRRKDELNADILQGHLSSALCHMANISFRLGELRNIGQDIRGLGFGEEGMVYDVLRETVEHLNKDHKLAGEQYRVGPILHLDPHEGNFRDNPQANALMTRDYRKGFEVPAKL